MNGATKAAVLLMAFLPFMPALVDDWLTSPTRLRMTPTERAIYWDLLLYQWKDGALPADHATLTEMAHVSPEDFARAAPAVLRNFNLRRGRYQNKKLALRRTSVLKRKTNSAQRGHKGGQAKANKDKKMQELAMSRASESVSVSSVVEVVVEEKTSCSEGFPDPEVLASVQTRVPVSRRKVSAGGNGEAPAWDPGPGWLQVEALCRQAPVAPAIRRPQLALQAYLSACEAPETLATILAGITAYKASSDVANGAVMSLENFLRDRCWQGSFARPPESETERERRRVMAL